MAGPRQRLHDHRARTSSRSSSALSASAGICEPHLGVFADGILLLCPSRRPAPTSPTCGSSTPTGPRPSCRGTAPARRSSTCATAAGRRRTSSPSTPPPGGSDPRSPARTPAGWTWAVASLTSNDYPGGPEDGTRHRALGRARVGLSPRLDREPAMRHPRRLGGRAGRARPPRPGTGHRSRPPLPEPHQRVLVHRARGLRDGPARSAPGSSSGGWGRRSPPERGPAAPPSPTWPARAGRAIRRP